MMRALLDFSDDNKPLHSPILSTAVQRTELTSMRCHSLKKSFYIDAITFTCSFLYTYIHASWWPTMGDKAHGTRSRCLITKKTFYDFV